MEEAHPAFIVVLMALIPVLSGVIVYFLALSRLPIIFSIPLVVIVGFAVYTYLHAMQTYYRKGKIRRLTALAVILALIIITPYVTYVVATPNWSFTVTTDKAVYKLGENITITATLRNLGYITHSFKSSLSDPILVTVPSDSPYFYYVYYSQHNSSISEFSIESNGLLKREFVWNQTDQQYGNQTSPGTYFVGAYIPDGNYQFEGPEVSLFRAHVHIEITS